MKLPSIAIALVLSAAAGAAVTAAAMPPAATPKGKTVTQTASKPADCHRDVRTHRIGGVKIRHRHVGDNCAVREVRQVN